jgi:AmmeMemoRadiSam system protein B
MNSKMAEIRKPIVAGQFYPIDKAELEKQVKSFIKRKPDNSIKAAIVPHAGYIFSGKCAGKIYSLLPASETYIILGVNHNALGKDIALSLENFETPLGEVKNDIELGKEILKKLNIEEDNNPHKYEHSIEVQLPFLQIIQKDLKIVPIILKNYSLNTCKNLAKIIADSANKLKKKTFIIASSDFTHAGPSYGFSGSIEIDKKAIDEILKLNSKTFLQVANTTTICGAGAIATIIETSKLLGAKKAKLLSYYTSAEIMPSENKVGYASIAFS